MTEPVQALYYCGGGMTDVGSLHAPHWAPQFKGEPKWCIGDPRQIPSPAAKLREEVRVLQEQLANLAERAYAKGFDAAQSYPNDLAKQVEDVNALAPLPCPDYPAPCNCDDPETHNGH